MYLYLCESKCVEKSRKYKQVHEEEKEEALRKISGEVNNTCMMGMQKEEQCGWKGWKQEDGEQTGRKQLTTAV